MSSGLVTTFYVHVVAKELENVTCSNFFLFQPFQYIYIPADVYIFLLDKIDIVSY